MKLFKRTDPNDPQDEWSVSTGGTDEAPIIIRLNTGCTRLVDSHPIQIGIAIPLNEPVPGGLPSPEEAMQLQAIEDELIGRLGDRAVLTAVITTGEMREFVAYAPSGDWIEKFHRDLEAAVPTHQVQVMAKNDAGWSVYKALAAQ